MLRASTLREMHRVHWIDPNSWANSWGLGFETHQDATTKLTVVGHGGACPGYSTQLSLLPALELAVVVMVNAPGTAAAIADVALRVLSKAVKQQQQQPYAQPAQPRTTEEEEASAVVAAGQQVDLSEYTGRYSGQPWQGEQVVVALPHGRLGLMALPCPSPEGPAVEIFQPVPSPQPQRSSSEEKGEEGGSSAVAVGSEEEGFVFRRVRADDSEGYGETLHFVRRRRRSADGGGGAGGGAVEYLSRHGQLARKVQLDEGGQALFHRPVLPITAESSSAFAATTARL